jgi:hypothetical protein
MWRVFLSLTMGRKRRGAAILDGSAGPRREVVHQVENEWSCDVTQGGGGCCSSMRMEEMKIIIGGPGDSVRSRSTDKNAPLN